MKVSMINSAVGIAAVLSLVGFAWLDHKASTELATLGPEGPSFLSMLAAWNKPMLAVPAGTKLAVQLEQAIQADRSTAGQTFSAVLLEPLMVRQHTLAPAGSRVQGLLTEVTAETKDATGNVQKARLRMVVRKLFVDGREYILTTLPLLSEISPPSTGFIRTANNAPLENGMVTRFIFTLSDPLELPVYKRSS